MSSVIALLRGINVGGKNKVPMQQLREVVASLGHEDVRTYVQSGNVVFRPAGGGGEDGALAADLERAIEDAFGVRSTVVLRSGEDMARVAARHPLATPGIEPAKLHVVFLREAPPGERVGQLDPDRSPPDRFEVGGREIYVLYPDGAARSKLTADYFERSLGVPATARNWNTVQKLVGMTAG